MHLRGGGAARACFAPDRVVVESLDAPWITSLLYDGDFITFFEERAVDGATQRRLVTERPQVADQMVLLAEAKAFARECWPGAWDCIRRGVLYVNWTDRTDVASSMDTRNIRGSFLLHDRRVLHSDIERMAWVLSCLYHDSKRLQFHDTYRPWEVPGTVQRRDAFAVLGEDIPQVPCAWRGSPAGRSLPEHLFAMQAFIPGTALCFAALLAEPKLSTWTRRHLAMDMRGINGGIGSLMLGRRHLTEIGHLLSDILRRDYAVHLLPLYQELDPASRGG